MRYVLWGDGESPHLLKWARTLALEGRVLWGERFELWAVSSRGFDPGFDAAVPPTRQLALHTAPHIGGGNAALLRELPRLARWLKRVRADWLHAHYLTSHGTLAWLASALLGAPGRLVGSAWGSDILVTPQQGWHWRWLTRRVLRACALTTSDSQHMARCMRQLGAREVMTFPFGLERLPEPPGAKSPWLFFANRGLEPIYAPQRVLEVFASVAQWQADARLVVAHQGSLGAAMQQQARALGLHERVDFVGHLDAPAQAECYAKARWYLSLPRSDSVSVSVLEAMAHGCVPVLSDLPANRELVRSAQNGLILADGALPLVNEIDALAAHAGEIARANHAWVAQHALFGPSVRAFLQRLRAFDAANAA